MKTIIKRDWKEYFSLSNFFLILFFVLLILNFLLNFSFRGDYSSFMGNSFQKRDIFTLSFTLCINLYFCLLVYHLFWNDILKNTQFVFSRIKKRTWLVQKLVSIFIFTAITNFIAMVLYCILCLLFSLPIQLGNLFFMTLGIIFIRYSLELIFLVFYFFIYKYSFILLATIYVFVMWNQNYQSLIFFSKFTWTLCIPTIICLFLIYFLGKTFMVQAYQNKEQME